MGKGTNRDKMQLNAFLFGCYVTSIDLRVTRKKKEEKNAVNVVLFTQKARNAFNLSHIVKNNVER